MEFAGRIEELEFLNQEYKANRASFIVIYGRRRIGKTTLIKKFIEGKDALYFLASEAPEKQNLKQFERLVCNFRGPCTPIDADSWAKLFDFVSLETTSKRILVIDEFPYLVSQNQAIPSVFQYIWDEILKDRNIMLILCGSYIRMMQKHTLSYSSPLYGRRTGQIHLKQLPFVTTYGFQNLSFSQAVEQYSVTGGVPRYIELFEDKETDIFTLLEKHVLNKYSYLREEPRFLFKDERLASSSYYAILGAIANGNHKIGKICSEIGCKSTQIMPYLTALIEMGYVEKQVSVTETNVKESRSGLYYICDNFSRFWFRYVFPFESELELDNTTTVKDLLKKTFISNHVALSYENICRQIFRNLCITGLIEFSPSVIGSWWQTKSNCHEIDITALDNINKRVFLGECKYRNSPVDTDVLKELQEKKEAFVSANPMFASWTIILGIFSKSGFTVQIKKAKESLPLLLINEVSLI